MSTIGLDRRLAGQCLLLTLLLCWPLLVFGRPAYFPDSLSYLRGGNVALGFVRDKLHLATGALSVAAATGPASVVALDAGASGMAVKGARSIPYSVLAGVLGGSDGAMVPLAVFQAFLTALITIVFLRAASVTDRRLVGTCLVLAFATPVAWVACMALPDIFAGITILVAATLGLWLDRLTRPVAAMLSLIGAFAVSTHASHIAIALVMLPLGLLMRPQARRAITRRTLPWIAAPVVLGIAAVVLAGLAGFGEVSVAPKRFPLTLARSIGDGPARWYLDRHCPTARYAACELFGNRMPRTSDDFLWGPHGVEQRATPAQMDRLRAEEAPIVLRATLTYPATTVAMLLRGVATQVVTFGVGSSDFDRRIVRDAAGGLVFADDPRTPSWARPLADGTNRLVALLAVLWSLACWLRAGPDQRAMTLLIVAGLLANAGVCAIFSAVADRYQARVIWLLPLAAVAMPPRPGRREPGG